MAMGMRGMNRGFLTEEEKANRPKVTFALLKRIFSYLSFFLQLWDCYLQF